METNTLICLLSYTKILQRREDNLKKRVHMSTVIKHCNLVQRQESLGREIRKGS